MKRLVRLDPEECLKAADEEAKERRRRVRSDGRLERAMVRVV
jgi:hypothetical protein